VREECRSFDKLRTNGMGDRTDRENLRSS